jgi:hypothetical protein
MYFFVRKDNKYLRFTDELFITGLLRRLLNGAVSVAAVKVKRLVLPKQRHPQQMQPQRAIFIIHYIE